MRKLLAFLGAFLLLLSLTVLGSIIFPEARGVRVVSVGTTHESVNHHHLFRSPCGAMAGGMPTDSNHVADQLIAIPLSTDFQIVIEGRYHRHPSYHFHQHIDDEWIRVLTVHPGTPDAIYRIHGRGRDHTRERVYASSFLNLLESGEYILEVRVSWGNTRSGSEGQHFLD
ncbi:MAG: hypothetical protein FWE12_07670 [Oscillospiraceae bacterium]|nr:hypothetical protein [Oscillospiraceae bacterium]